jgi:transcriptional regulator with XRE-family HTH domain
MSKDKTFDLKQIGRRLREVRKKLGKTQEEMRQITGLSTAGISEMEQGLKKPSSVYMFALKTNFDVNINWILTGEGTMFSPDIELELTFGDDNKIIQELILCVTNLPFVRYHMLKCFLELKRENPHEVEGQVKKVLTGE